MTESAAQAPAEYYLERIKSKVGTGDTAKSASMDNFWKANELEGGRFKMELLDNNFQPCGYAEEIPASELGKRFQPLPDFTPPKPMDANQQRADRLTARAERYLANNELLSAEFDFANALKLDEENVRANFGLGKTYVAMGEPDKAKEVFQKLSKIDAVTDPQNKHIFNEFGIQLRKMGMFLEAAQHYHRAIKLSPSDENLWFNLGRTLYEGGHQGKAQHAMTKALTINPDFEDALNFKQLIERAQT